jgi:lipase
LPAADLPGRRIAWREAGRGEPALLLHCALAHSGAFAGLMARLEGRLAMRALDLPGHGGTGRHPDLTPQAQGVADALALLDGAGPAHVVGHSFGGTVALRLAVEAPGAVASLTLIEPVMFGFLADAGGPAYAREMADEAPYRRAAEAGDWPAAADAFLSRWGSGTLADLPPSQAAYILERIRFIAESECDLYEHPARRLHLDDLAGLAMPVLLVAGARSPPVIHAILDAIASRLPRARRTLVPGAAHMVPVSHPGAVAEAIRAALAEPSDQPS